MKIFTINLEKVKYFLFSCNADVCNEFIFIWVHVESVYKWDSLLGNVIKFI